MKILDIVILTKEQVDKLPVNMLNPRKSYEGWWTCSQGEIAYDAFVVYCSDGTYKNFHRCSTSAKHTEEYVRPALIVDHCNIKSFKLDSYEWINIFDNYYLCNGFIGTASFNAALKYARNWLTSKGFELNKEYEIISGKIMPSKDPIVDKRDKRFLDFVDAVSSSQYLQIVHDDPKEFFKINFSEDRLKLKTRNPTRHLFDIIKTYNNGEQQFLLYVRMQTPDGDNIKLDTTFSTYEKFKGLMETFISLLRAIRTEPFISIAADELENCV